MGRVRPWVRAPAGRSAGIHVGKRLPCVSGGRCRWRGSAAVVAVAAAPAAAAFVDAAAARCALGPEREGA